MIIPIGHDQSVRRMPWLTLGIIALCTLIQVYSSFFAPSEEEIGMQLLAFESQVPEMGPEEDPAAHEQYMKDVERHVKATMMKLPILRWGYVKGSGPSINLVTSAFVHAGWVHLIGNMLFLWLAGSALEDRYGRLRFAAFYLLGAGLSTLVWDVASRQPEAVLVGASGAISACMGAFLVHFRKTQITFWYLFGRGSGTFRISAYIALPLWLADQVLATLIVGAMDMVSPIAYEAHIGGFVVGGLLGFASTKLFPQDAAEDDIEYDTPVPPPQQVTDAQLDDRVGKCLAALERRDMSALRTQASRVILDLSRAGQDRRILELYREIAKATDKPPLTDGAYAAVAAAADNLDERRGYVAIAASMMQEHPGSGHLAKVLWRLAQLRRDAGQHDLEAETLRTLADRFAKDPYGQKAQRELDRDAGIALE